jgi:hypothetical protein
MQTSSSVTLATINRHLHRYGIRSLRTSTDIGSVGFENHSSEDIRSSGLVNGRLMMFRGTVVVCRRTDSPTMDCSDLCLEAF